MRGIGRRGHRVSEGVLSLEHNAGVAVIHAARAAWRVGAEVHESTELDRGAGNRFNNVMSFIKLFGSL